jgi:hypothetical protein
METVQEALTKLPHTWTRWLWALLVFVSYSGAVPNRLAASTTGSGRKRRASRARSEAQPSGVKKGYAPRRERTT